MNMNDTVRFVLTPAGECIIREHDRERNTNLPPDYRCDWFKHHQPIDEKGTREEQLWVLMGIFGQHLQIGGEAFFKDNEIEAPIASRA